MSKDKKNKKTKKEKIGTFSSLVQLTKEVIANRPKIQKKEKLDKKDIIAFILTIIIVAGICAALWFIPATNSWIRKELLY